MHPSELQNAHAAAASPDARSEARQTPCRKRTNQRTGGRRMLGERSALLVELSKRPNGITGKDAGAILSICSKVTAAILNDLAKTGRVHRAEVARIPLHFFDTAARAREWESRQDYKNWALDLRKATSITNAKVTASQPLEVTTKNGVKHTQGPSTPFDQRYQMDPETRVVGGFSTLGIGRYLESVAA